MPAEDLTSPLDRFSISRNLPSPPRRKRGAENHHPMKKDLHPKYNPVVFVDMTTGKRFISRSTKSSDKKEVIDGVEHSIISIGITSDSHPFFTGLAQFVDTEGRIDKFQKRFGAVRRVGKPKLD
jgi:large subunit ribosomal protein L31